MNKSFLSEREGQLNFFDKFAIVNTELANNTDGVYKGTIFEFKKNISDINTVLFQAIKYLSHMRIKGESIPANILLVALNEEVAYLFNAKDYLAEIETIYAGAASKNNADFAARTSPKTIHYNTPSGIRHITDILEDASFVKVTIDVFDVVGWANRFYRENPSSSKIKLFNELREPKYFGAYIHPWKGDEKDFKYIMDLLNDTQHKKELGAFYTPPEYCRKATELVRRGIKQLPNGHDYIILDRCAGTGNLEEFLTDKAVKNITIMELDRFIDKTLKAKYLKDKADVIMTFYSKRNFNEITVGELEKHTTRISLYDYIFDNELSHAVVNTYELKEWIVLNERIGDRVKLIIPPPQEIDNTEALVEGGDALSTQFVTGQKSIGMSKEYNDSIGMLMDCVANKKVNIILLENPPYSDTSADKVREDGLTRDVKKDSHVAKDFKNLFTPDVKGMVASKEIANLFIWSAWAYYLRKPDDYYVLFSPIKYWKSHKLGEHKFIDGFLFNREHFHAGASAISCILWKNESESKSELTLRAFDIDTSQVSEQEEGDLIFVRDIPVKKVHKTFNEYYFDKRKFEDDTFDGVYCDMGGREAEKTAATSTEKIFNKNILAYEYLVGFTFGAPKQALVRTTLNARKNGFYLRADNFIEKLPLFAAKLYPQKNWYERDIYFTTADGGDVYLKDKDFLKACFIFACLSQRNHCRSFEGGDGRFYKNELCFDKVTLASKKLKDFKLTSEEQDLLDIFSSVLKKAKNPKYDEYNPKYAYGTYQIDEEININYKDDNGEIIYKYPELNTDIRTLKTKLAKYYETNIQPKLFEYQLLK